MGRDSTYYAYHGLKNAFIEFCEEECPALLSISIDCLSKKDVSKFLDFLLLKRKVGNRSYNNYLQFLKALFNTLISK